MKECLTVSLVLLVQGRDMPLDVELDDMTTYLLREPSMLGLVRKHPCNPFGDVPATCPQI